MGTDIVKSGVSLLPLTENNPKFAETYGDKLKEVIDELPSTRSIEEIINKLPEDLQSKVIAIAKKMSGKKKGQYGEQDNTSITELKLYQGTGKDLNRPEKQIPGEFYLTTKTNVGEKFRGTILTTVNGQSKWDSNNSNQPLCHSMDRKMGNNHGECANCVHRPWRNKQKQQCNKDVTVYMIPDTLDNIILARFTKTSEPTGRRLLTFMSRGIGENWSKWYEFSSEQREQKSDPSKRYFVWDVQPVAGNEGYTPEELDSFFYALCTLVEATYILPNIARIYEQAMDGEPSAEEEESPGVDDDDSDDTYGEVPKAPEDEEHKDI